MGEPFPVPTSSRRTQESRTRATLADAASLSAFGAALPLPRTRHRPLPFLFPEAIHLAARPLSFPFLKKRRRSHPPAPPLAVAAAPSPPSARSSSRRRSHPPAPPLLARWCLVSLPPLPPSLPRRRAGAPQTRPPSSMLARAATVHTSFRPCFSGRPSSNFGPAGRGPYRARARAVPNRAGPMAIYTWWPPALVQQLFPLMVSNPPRVYRFHRELRNMSTISRVKGMSTNSGVKDDDSGKPYRRLPITPVSENNKHSAIPESIRNIEKRGIITISEVLAGDERTNKDACRTTLEVADTGGHIVKHLGCEEVQRRAPMDERTEFVVSDDEVSDVDGYTVNILAKSTHRDGSIYRGMDTWWKEEYRIVDRNETRLEAMMLSESTDCIFYDGTCVKHYPGRMLQIFSIKVANISVAGDSVELYGYIATRDDIDQLLNHIFHFSRDDPIIARQGSVINMTGPKRGIDICDRALIEYDIRIKTGEHEQDDLQLIDGISIIGHVGTWNRPFSIHIPGDCGAVQITLSRLEPAVEATIYVLVSEVQRSFNLFLGCFTSGLNKEIQLFDGAISEPCGLNRYVVAVVVDDLIDLKFKVGALSSNSDQLRCTFEAKTHGHDTQEIRTDFALLSVKVTWSTLPRGTLGL